ncbi:MAG: diheme cytochrome c-553 [Thermodesulfobacteriota bacterium]
MSARHVSVARAGLLAVAALLLSAGVTHAQEVPPALGHSAPGPAARETSGATAAPEATPTAPPAAVEEMIERGAYLVKIGGCNDCHTPHVAGPAGLEPDQERMLSGHPEDLDMPPPPALPPGPWRTLGSETRTAFAGPWGVSYARNLTPDDETGIGSWSEEDFTEAMRNGRHRGGDRPILPPMPWQNVARLTDDDLRSLYRYLTSIPPIRNRVPDPVVAGRKGDAVTPPAAGTRAAAR